ncbi:MAG: hypothetical protein RJA20_80 [Bacteroidota bacterium]|jgi:hypothetical protein
MANQITATLFSNWHFTRIFRAGIAFFAFSEAWRTGDSLLLGMGGVLALQALFNAGCCGAGGCSVTDKDVEIGSDAVTYEEVK